MFASHHHIDMDNNATAVPDLACSKSN